jgi:hypothetical protein
MKSYVYFIYDADNDVVKIGKANNVAKRMGSIVSGNPFSLNMVKTIECDSEEEAFKLEKDLHKKYNSVNYNREWFEAKTIIEDYDLQVGNLSKLEVDVNTILTPRSYIQDNVELTGAIDYVNLNISELFILSNVNPKLHIATVKKRLINGTSDLPNVMVYSDKKWDKALLKEFELQDIKPVKPNLSSSRAVSITDTFESKSVSIAFVDNKITAGITQSFGRFRYNETQLILVGDNLSEEKIVEQLKEIDPYLFNTIKKVIFKEFNGTAVINKIEGLLVSASEKDRKTLDKKQSVIDFSKTIDIKTYQTKIQLFNDYTAYCEDNQLKPVSKNTLHKELPILSKEELAYNSALNFKTKTYNNGAVYESIGEWYSYYKKDCKQNKLKIASKELFTNIKVKGGNND